VKQKIIVRIKGGLGNQLFCYAAARRLSLVNDIELVIDDVTGFVRDDTYRRKYMLDHFSIPCRKATAWERKEPFERARRALSKLFARHRPYEARTYIEQEMPEFDNRLMSLQPKNTLYLDGLWQDERYFLDIAETIRSELTFRVSPTEKDQQLSKRISECQSVALHVRWFDSPNKTSSQRNLTSMYYQEAITEMEERLTSPHYFLFSDNIYAALQKISIPQDRLTCLDYDKSNERTIVDMWLMHQCKHFIMANSTFSWWGAWLGRSNNGIIVMPDNVPHLRNALMWQGAGLWKLNKP